MNYFIGLALQGDLTADQTDRFRMTGTMHLFAISGLHIGVVAAVIAQALLLIRIPRKCRPFIGLPLLYLYVEITGAAPSAVRAFLMVAFFWASIAVARQRSPFAALVASAVFVLIIQPRQLWEIGFQLSYLVVFSILLLGLPLHAMLWSRMKPFEYLPKENWGTIRQGYAWSLDKGLLLFAISFSAWIVSAPLGAGFFGYIAPYAIIVNLLLVNLAALVISTGILSLGGAVVGMAALSAFLNHAAWLILSLMDGIVAMNLKLPMAVLICPGYSKDLSYTIVLLFVVCLLIGNATGKQSVRFLIAPALVLAGLCLGLLQA